MDPINLGLQAPTRGASQTGFLTELAGSDAALCSLTRNQEISMLKGMVRATAMMVVYVCVTGASADVFNMGGSRNTDGTWTGLASLETVTVGNPGNTGEWSGESYGGYGPDRICGAVGYTYNIGKYEVTAGQYTEFLNAVAATDTYGLYSTTMASGSGCQIKRTGVTGSYTYSVATDWANRPVNYVSWGDAARFSNWLHNGQPIGVQDMSTTEDGAYYLNGAMSYSELEGVTRAADATWVLPSEDEWYKAGYHKNDGATGHYFDYPTSSDNIPSNDLIKPDPGNNANFYPGTYTIGSPYYRTQVGAHENSASPYGTFDQGGNVWEWNETILFTFYRGSRGGSCLSPVSALHASNRYGSHPTSNGSSVGFRVAKVPEPATIIMLSLVGLRALRRGSSKGLTLTQYLFTL